jgi:5-dehydro-2-deoxygluconokinase
VVVLGLSAPQDALIAALKTAARHDIVKGFAVGRTIFEAPAREWLAGRIDDDEAVHRLAHGFQVLIDAWRGVRRGVAAPAAVAQDA